MWKVDARVAVRFGTAEDAGADEYVLPQSAFGGHVMGCACCGGARSGAGLALAALFEQRARGTVAFFRRVVVVTDEAGRTAVTEALRDDPVASARFRLET